MKSVWFLNHYAQEPAGPGGTRHFSLARGMRNYGWKASIIAASTEHGTNRDRLAPHETARLDHFDDVPFLWLKTSAYAGNGADRIRNMVGYTRAALARDNTKDLTPPDVIVGSSVHPFAAWAGLRLAQRYRVPFVFEVRDLWPQTLVDMGRLPQRHPVTYVLQRLERYLYKRAEKIVVLLPHAHKYIEPLGIDGRKIEWVPNGIELEIFPRPEPKPAADTFTLMYFGAHGTANGLDNVLRAMAEVRTLSTSRPVNLRVIGDGPLKPSLMAMAKDMGLENVAFEDPVPKRQIAQLAADADAFVFNLIDAPVFKYGISSNKLFDFMACGRPVIFACESSNNPVDAAGGGLTVPAGQPRLLAEAIARLEAMPPDAVQAMGVANRDHIEANYEFDLLGRKFAGVLEAACERRERR